MLNPYSVTLRQRSGQLFNNDKAFHAKKSRSSPKERNANLDRISYVSKSKSVNKTYSDDPLIQRSKCWAKMHSEKTQIFPTLRVLENRQALLSESYTPSPRSKESSIPSTPHKTYYLLFSICQFLGGPIGLLTTTVTSTWNWSPSGRPKQAVYMNCGRLLKLRPTTMIIFR